jgi:Uma2 family endonuclease
MSAVEENIMISDAPVRARLSVEEYLALPESNHIVELIDGELYMTVPEDIHQKRAGRIYAYLLQATKGRGELRFAPTGVQLFDGATVLESDLFWISPANTICVLRDKRIWFGAPDLIVEIVSPSTARRDYRVKYDLYQGHGVREYWIVQPETPHIDVFQRGEDGQFAEIGTFDRRGVFESALLGVTVAVAEVFGEDSP